jgi:hypothetical protein
MPSRDKTPAWMTQDCSPRVFFLLDPWQVPCRPPRDWAAARSPLRGAFRLGGLEILTILVAEPQPSLRNHHDEPACSCASNVHAGALHDIGCPGSVAVSGEWFSADALSGVASGRELGFVTSRGEMHAAHPFWGGLAA